MTAAVLLSLIFPFHVLASPVHYIGFPFNIIPRSLAIYISLSADNNNLICFLYLVVIEQQQPDLFFYRSAHSFLPSSRKVVYCYPSDG